jgi:putative hemolysin
MESILILPVGAMLALLASLLIISFLFSASEIALFSFRKTRLALLAKQQNRTALLIQRILLKPDELLSTILVGNNIVNTGISVLGTTLALYFFGEKGIYVAMVVLTVILIQFCEITPKVLASQYWEKFAFALARPLRVFYYVFYPLIAAFSFITKKMLRIFNVNVRYHKPIITKDELKHIVSLSTESGHLKESETFLLMNVFEFTDRLVSEVMIPRDKIAALDMNLKQEQVVDFIMEEHYTRLPVYDGDLDNIVGMLHIKDYFNVICYKDIIVLVDLLRKPLFVGDNVRISELLKEFQKKHVHIAIVRDDDKKTIGLVTMENILEQIVGDIRDEHE